MNTAAAAELEHRIHQAIPLSQAMGYRITTLADTQITVEAPLGPNVNIHGTGFAGSLYALGILTAWGLCAHIIARAGLEAELVVSEANIRYRAPVKGDIVCRCKVTAQAAQAFVDGLVANGHSRMKLEVAVGERSAAVIRAEMYVGRRRQAPASDRPVRAPQW